MNMNEEYEDGMYREVEDENNPVYDYDDQSIETGYSQPAEERSSFMQNLTLANKQINTNLSLAQNIGGLYSDCIKLREHRKEVEALTQVKLAGIVAKYKTAEKFITSSFSERNDALKNYYAVLDDAVRKGDKELIISAMANISGIVTTSPLKDLEKLCESFNDSLDGLLDFE